MVALPSLPPGAPILCVSSQKVRKIIAKFASVQKRGPVFKGGKRTIRFAPIHNNETKPKPSGRQSLFPSSKRARGEQAKQEGRASETMAQLQEAQFACFEDEEIDSSSSSHALLNGGSADFALHRHHHQQQQSGLKTFAIAEPSSATRSLAQKSFARGALLRLLLLLKANVRLTLFLSLLFMQCARWSVRDPGAFTFRTRRSRTDSSGAHAFASLSLYLTGVDTDAFRYISDCICCFSWRVIKNIVVLREWSLHETLAGNGIRLQFPGTFSVQSPFPTTAFVRRTNVHGYCCALLLL